MYMMKRKIIKIFKKRIRKIKFVNYIQNQKSNLQTHKNDKSKKIMNLKEGRGGNFDFFEIKLVSYVK